MPRSVSLQGLKGRLGMARRAGYEWLAPKTVQAAEHFNGSTVAVLEYPFAPEARWGWGRPPHPGLHRIFSQGVEHYAMVVSGMTEHAAKLADIPSRPAHGVPGWDNGYFPGLDAVRLYDALARRRPATYLEVGSGWSTLFARRALSDHGLSTRIVSIDPHPRADVDAACDVVHRVPLGQADLDLFGALSPGDVVLIDGSHTAFMGSDSVIAALDVLDAIPDGVLVGIHDIFLPWDYPPEWSRRWYGEQYVIAGLLLGGEGSPRRWSIDFPAWFVYKETPLTDGDSPLWKVIGDPPGRVGSALWLQRSDGLSPRS